MLKVKKKLFGAQSKTRKVLKRTFQRWRAPKVHGWAGGGQRWTEYLVVSRTSWACFDSCYLRFFSETISDILMPSGLKAMLFLHELDQAKHARKMIQPLSCKEDPFFWIFARHRQLKGAILQDSCVRRRSTDDLWRYWSAHGLFECGDAWYGDRKSVV